MSSGTSSIVPSKLASPPSNFNYSQAPPSTGIDISQRRSNSSGSFGSGASTRQPNQSRGSQPLRKQHKASRRAKLTDDDELAEVAAMRSTTNRKGQTSITHLMNFALPPRPQYQYQHHNFTQRPHRHNRTWGLGSGYHAIDKARYVHANYRFIVKPDKEYHMQTIDADVYVSWDSVLQVLASSETQSTNCPICLSTPVAPRMAKCGHISCLPCLIRYMHSTDEAHPVPEKRARWKKCPICEDSIYISETRPVRWFVGQEASMLREGGDVLLKLLMRKPGVTLAMPRDAAEKYGHHEDIPWYHVAEMMDYARFMKGGEDYMVSQYDQEIADLEAQEKEDELMFGDDTTWTRKAIAAIMDAKLKVEGMGNPPPSRISSAAKTTNAIPESWDDDDKSQEQNNSQSELTKAAHRLTLKPESNRVQSHEQRSDRQTSHSFFFYHALPNFYLSPLDIRILKAAFGDFSNFPSTILPRVEHISTGHIIDDDLRKRAKYMAHLPYGYEVNFLECDWTDTIGPTVLDEFTEEIEKRRKRNSDKEAREERDRIRAEKEEEDKRWAAARRQRPPILPKSFSEMDFVPLAPTEPSLEAHSNDPPLAATPPWANNRTQSSFATLASPGTSPDAARTVWGTAAIAPKSPVLTAAPEKTPNLIDDGWLQDWEKDLLDERDAVALVEASMNGESSSNPVASGKKGKKKKITLMSTGNRRQA